jgi:hypothetical protein
MKIYSNFKEQFKNKTNEEKIKLLKNKYKNKDCVILTCGPSFSEYSKDIIKNFIKDKVVICVKETILEFKDECHFFFQNDTRKRKYDFNNKTITIFQKCKKLTEFYDIILDEDRPFNINTQLLKIKNFNKYLLDNNIKRPWGPGILYESVFYFCYHIGIKNVYTIGWDLIDVKSVSITHYFDNYDNYKYKNSQRWNGKDFKNEMIMVNNEIVHMYHFFKHKGMNIIVCGNKSFVNNIIPRRIL